MDIFFVYILGFVLSLASPKIGCTSELQEILSSIFLPLPTF